VLLRLFYRVQGRFDFGNRKSNPRIRQLVVDLETVISANFAWFLKSACRLYNRLLQQCLLMNIRCIPVLELFAPESHTLSLNYEKD
jgi:hypothetical protein